MYNAFRQMCARLLRMPHDTKPPPGDEASTRLFRAAPKYYKYLLFLWALRAGGTLLILCISVLPPVLVGTITLVKQGKDWGLLLLAIPGVLLVLAILLHLFLLAVLQLDFEKRWYMVTDRSLRIREGVVTVREMTVNFANIQNISISQGPIQRALGIADLRVDTAGGGSGKETPQSQNLHTAWFRGIDNANEVRELIQLRLRQLKDSGLGDHEEMVAPASPPAQFSGVLAALREVRSEASALRQAAANRS